MTTPTTPELSADIMYAVVEQAADMLRTSAETVHVEDCHWISDSDNYPEDYCFDCATAIAERGVVDTVHGDMVTVDGGWRSEHDSPPYCEGCGARLGYSPTDYCTGAEIDNYLEYWDDDIRPEEALDLLNIFEAVGDPIHYGWCGDARDKAAAHKQLADAFTLAERVISSVIFATSGMDRRTVWSDMQ